MTTETRTNEEGEEFTVLLNDMGEEITWQWGNVTVADFENQYTEKTK